MENVSENLEKTNVVVPNADVSDETAPRPLLWRRLLAPRNLWGAATGAITAIIVCQLATLLFWKLALYGRPIIVVWGISNEAVAWRGALVGFLVGWWGRSFKPLMLAIFASAAILFFHDWQALARGFVLTGNRFDFLTLTHILAFSLLVGAIVHGALKMQEGAKVSLD